MLVVANLIGLCATPARAGGCILRSQGFVAAGPRGRVPFGRFSRQPCHVEVRHHMNTFRFDAVAHGSASLDRARAGFGLVNGTIGFAIGTGSPLNTAIARS